MSFFIAETHVVSALVSKRSDFYEVWFMNVPTMRTDWLSVRIAPMNRFKSLERFRIRHSYDLHQTEVSRFCR